MIERNEGVAALSAVEQVEKAPVKAEKGKGLLSRWDALGAGWLPLMLCFLLPFLIFLVCLVLMKVYPAGDQQIINYDGWHQYYPFVMKLWDHFHEGQSLLYDWSMGMGTNFLSMISYYGASPFNLLLILVPVRDFRVLFMLFTALRIGLAGLFMGLFLKKVLGGSWTLPFFSLGYALCSFVMGYAWNNIWLDTVALLPLVMWGLVKLFREGKCTLYVVSLAISLFASYYIGWMVCIFCVMGFFALWVLDRVPFYNLWRRALRFGGASLLAGALGAVLLLPAYFGLLNTVSTASPLPMYHTFYESVRDLVASLASFHTPTVLGDPQTELCFPNIATSALLVLFAFAFLWAKRIDFREKLVGFIVVLFLLFSMNYSFLNYLWHGLHFTNMIPYRFAFLFAFVVVVMAYRYYTVALEEFDWIDGVGMLLFAALVAFCAFGRYENGAVLGTVGVFCLGIVLCVLRSVKVLPRRLVSVAVCLCLLAEMGINAYLGTKAVGTSGYSSYFADETGKEVQALVDHVKELEAEKGDFYRMEVSRWYSLNDSCFYNYNGISQFSSSANVRVSYFLQGLGMPADPGSNRFVYSHGTPLSNTLLGVKYLISKEGYLSDGDLTCLRASTNDFTAALYQCDGFLGAGFMVEEEAAEFRFDLTMAPLDRQNELFRALTGLEGDLFESVRPAEQQHYGVDAVDHGDGNVSFTATAIGENEARKLHYLYTLPDEGTVYIFAEAPAAVHAQVNNAWYDINDYPNLFSAGYFREGETFHLRTFLNGLNEGDEDYAFFQVCTFNEALWEEGLALLADETLQVEEWGDTTLSGKVNARRDGYLYTSIPAELAHAWEVTVDGEKAEITPFAGSFVGVYLEEGEHEVVFSYSPLGFSKGRIISLAALVLLCALAVFERKGILFPDRPPKAVTEPADEAPSEGDLPLEEKTEKGGEPRDTAEAHEPDPQGD